jgi:hypothetical protein
MPTLYLVTNVKICIKVIIGIDQPCSDSLAFFPKKGATELFPVADNNERF